MRHYTNKAVLLGALLLASTLAHAQFAWIDEKGVRHYSDQPPPTDTPDARILKTPRGMARPAPAADAPAAPATAPAPKPAPTLAEREADYAKRQAKAVENDKKAAAEKNLADAKRAQCTAAAQNKAQLSSGQATRNAANVPLTDADRARELASAEKILRDCN